MSGRGVTAASGSNAAGVASIGSAATGDGCGSAASTTCGGRDEWDRPGQWFGGGHRRSLPSGQRFDAAAKCGDLGARRDRLEEADDTQEPAGDQDQHEQYRERSICRAPVAMCVRAAI